MRFRSHALFWLVISCQYIMKKELQIIGIAIVLGLCGNSVHSQATLQAGKIGSNYQFCQVDTLDEAILGVRYRYEQKALQGDSMVVLQDTMLLAIGPKWSLFVDESFNQQLQSWFKANLARARKTRTPSEDISLVDAMEMSHCASDIDDGNLGLPVHIYKNRSQLIVNSYLVHNLHADWAKCEQVLPELARWSFNEGTDTILGYPCMHASVRLGGRCYDAWFSVEVPVSEGPWKFMGLPGLILKVEDEDGLFCYETIGITKYESTWIVHDCLNYKKANLKEFNKIVKKRMESLPASFISAGRVYNYTWKPYSYFDVETE